MTFLLLDHHKLGVLAGNVLIKEKKGYNIS